MGAGWHGEERSLIYLLSHPTSTLRLDPLESVLTNNPQYSADSVIVDGLKKLQNAIDKTGVKSESIGGRQVMTLDAGDKKKGAYSSNAEDMPQSVSG